MATLAEIRAKLQAQENRSQGNSGTFGDGAIFPHWNIPEGTTTVLRFLPDADSTNSFFWVEKAMIKLPFNGIKGGDSRPIIVQVPCMEMWNEACPVLTEVRTWFKDKNLEDMGRKYWKKRSYIFQGFVRENPLDEQSPENPIRRFILGPSLFGIVKASLLDPDLENLPTDYNAGLDLKVTKATKGGFADYGSSAWARRESPLTEAERKAIEQFGLSSLRDHLPKKPSSIELGIIQEMFEASVDGKAYDADRLGQYFKAPGMNNESSKPAESAPAAKAEPEAKEAPWEEKAEPVATAKAEAPSGGEDKAAAILAMIRSRQAKPA
jgi:hypothetical protein